MSKSIKGIIVKSSRILICFFLVCVVVVFTFSLQSCKDDVVEVKKNDSTSVNPSPNLELILVQPGTFRMGSDTTLYGLLDKPTHYVTLTKPFYMGKYEVTSKLWREVMGENHPQYLGDNYPADSITLKGALDFCNALSEKEGLKKCYASTLVGRIVVPDWDKNANGYRLPTEAEWEYVCRAGTLTNTYNGEVQNLQTADLVLDQIAWYKENSGGSAHQVGLKKPNAWGFYDMSGNAGEMVIDQRDKYSKDSLVNPYNPVAVGSENFGDCPLRGGNYMARSFLCLSHCRLGAAWNLSGNQIYGGTKGMGLRIVRNK